MPTILIVDDELNIRTLYSEFLKQNGYEVELAENGEKALEIARSKKVDIIILDIELEETSGLEVLKQIKAENPQIPIVLNSAYAVYKNDFSSWVADDYILKSSDLSILKSKIEEMVIQ